MFFDLTTKEMMDEINQTIYSQSSDECWFFVRENQEILVSVLVHCDTDDVEIQVEWRECDPYKPLKSSIVSFANKKDLESAVDYIRACAEF